MKITRTHRWTLVGTLAVAAALLTATLQPAAACPFCSAVSLTFSEEIAQSDLVVIAKIVERAPTPDPNAPLDAPAPLTGFEIQQTLKGQDILGDNKAVKAVYFGQDPDDAQFLLMGIGKTDTQWSTPIALTPRAVEYLGKLAGLPEKGPERLKFFEQYLEDTDDLMGRDAYDEFARAPYADVVGLKEHLHREKLLGWISDPKIMTSHRRLYLTMLGICGQPDDLSLLETMIRSEDREMKTALDALIACYLTLKGAEGLPLIEDLFLKNTKAEYTDTYSAIMALRFHGQEEKILPMDRLLAALRHMLDRPDLADLVIPDLARWEDWSVVDRLVELFKSADEKSSWVRVPVVNYLRACPLPEAKQQIDELAKIDPEAVQRANSFFPLGSAPADAQVPPAGTTDAAATAAATEAGDAAAAAPSTTASDASTEPAGPSVAASDLPPAPVAEEGTPAAEVAAPLAPAPSTPPAAETAATPEPAPAEPAASESKAAAGSPAARPAASPPAPPGWPIYVAPVAIAAVLFLAFQWLLRANRPSSVA